MLLCIHQCRIIPKHLSFLLVLYVLFLPALFFNHEHFSCLNLCKWCNFRERYLRLSLASLILKCFILNYSSVLFGSGCLLTWLSAFPVVHPDACLFFVVVVYRKLRRSSTTISSCLSWRSRDTTGSSVQSHEPGQCQSRTVNTWMVVQFSTRQKSMYPQLCIYCPMGAVSCWPRLIRVNYLFNLH